jgi:hypothetical protein
VEIKVVLWSSILIVSQATPSRKKYRRVWSAAYTNLVLSSRIWRSILDMCNLMEWARYNVGGLKYSAREQNEIDVGG